jgi:hypothetical protein
MSDYVDKIASHRAGAAGKYSSLRSGHAQLTGSYSVIYSASFVGNGAPGV